jgi:hypothetical protein
MVISQPAIYCLEASKSRLADGFVVRWWRRLGRGRASAAVSRPEFPTFSPADATRTDAVAPVPPVPTVAEPGRGGWRGVPRTPGRELDGDRAARPRRRLARLVPSPSTPFPGGGARLRGGGPPRPALDLATIPTFWDLERAAHEGIVRVYETEGHGRRAAVLAARLRERFRPRLVPRRANQAEQAGASIG